MSDELQPGQHLDADTLAAFAEGALPPHEREPVLLHLATCAHCRELVGLALPPFEELQPAGIVAARRGWRLGWWMGAAACTAGAALGAVLLLHAPPPGAPAPTAVAKMDAPPLPEPGAAEPRLAPRKVPVEAKRMAPPPSFLKLQKPAPVAAKEAPLTAAEASSPAPTPGAPPVAAQPSAKDAARPLPPEARMRTEAAPLAPEAAPAAPPPMVETNALRLAPEDSILVGELPSHLPAVSRSSSGKRVVAADSAGTVFWSKDAGRHWRAVKAPWSGRVVQVSAAKEPGASFALQTSNGERWVSSDGKRWTRGQ